MTSHDVDLYLPYMSAGSRLITTANFCMNGKLAVAGTYDGRCIFYETEVSSRLSQVAAAMIMKILIGFMFLSPST